MRRKDRAVYDRAEISGILDQCAVCRIAMVDGGRPYVVPMNFGYEWLGERLAIYLHCAGAGRKLDALREGPDVCFEADCAGRLTGAGDLACAYSYAYQSVIAQGRA